ncbi:MAG: LUD domain-containing protein [Anaerovoracaceae bacterium]
MEGVIIERTIENLKRNGFSVKFFEDSQSAKEATLEEIKPDQTVGFGGSITLSGYGYLRGSERKGQSRLLALESRRR